jgi:hypothetical protein
VTRNVRERHPVVVTGPGMPVTSAEARGVHLHDHSPWRGHRIGDRPDVDRTAELLEHHGAHELIIP